MREKILSYYLPTAVTAFLPYVPPPKGCRGPPSRDATKKSRDASADRGHQPPVLGGIQSREAREGLAPMAPPIYLGYSFWLVLLVNLQDILGLVCM